MSRKRNTLMATTPNLSNHSVVLEGAVVAPSFTLKRGEVN